MRKLVITIELPDEGSPEQLNGSDDIYADDVGAVLAEAGYNVTDVVVEPSVS